MHAKARCLKAAILLSLMLSLAPSTVGAATHHDGGGAEWQGTDSARESALLRDEVSQIRIEATGRRFAHSRVFPLQGACTVECGLGCGCATHGGNHQGQDFGTQGANPPAVAVADGVVLSAGWDSGYGNLVVIDQGDGVLTRYAHLNELFVTAGQMVSQGQQIGLVGSTGFAEGNHLHFEILIDGVAHDPMGYL